MHHHPAGGGTPLTGGADGAENNGLDRHFKIGAGRDNDGIISPQFED